ncbi:MAG: HAMP domain-containing protein, partial [Acidobacteria bacterium]|nr:HAMP domain-containing protein [Acidobacteriota bacterium]
MSSPKLLNSFRVRLLLVLASLLVATLGVQYFLNRREEQRVAQTIARQEQALTASIALALESLPRKTEYLEDVEREHTPRLREEHPSVMNVLIVRNDGRVDDSLDPAYKPRTLDDGSYHYFSIREVKLPRLVDAGHDSEEIKRMMSPASPPGLPVAGEHRAFPIRVPTSGGSNFIVIVLGSPEGAPGSDSEWEVTHSLIPTLAIVLVASSGAAFLVWRFTKPIQELSGAARRVAAGDFDFRVPSATRSDEMGALARVFNEMLAGLGRLREVESRLNQAERSAVVGRLASAIAHEIRNPLNYINLSLDHLRTSLAPSNPEKRAVVEKLTGQLKTEVQRINTRITEFLTYSRPAKLEMRPLDLRATLEDALRIVEAQAADSLIEIAFEAAGDVPRVAGDAESLRSLFTNLIINAVQAIDIDHRGGRLAVALAREGADRVRVEVSDTGAGIPEENVPQIFE